MQTNRIFLLLVVLMIIGCSENDTTNARNHLEKFTHEEYLKSATSNPVIIPGEGIGKLKLGETRCKYLFNSHIIGSTYINDGIFLQYENGDTLIGITIDNKRIYRTPDGKRIGLTEKDILKEFGEPYARGTHISKGETIIGVLPTLHYGGISFIFQSDTSRIIQIHKEDVK